MAQVYGEHLDKVSLHKENFYIKINTNWCKVKNNISVWLNAMVQVDGPCARSWKGKVTIISHLLHQTPAQGGKHLGAL